jgi:hypothetical protein
MATKTLDPIKPTVAGFQLCKYREYEGLSEETTAFAAEIWRGARRVGSVKNRGQGGPHEYGWLTKPDREAFYAAARDRYRGEPEWSAIERLTEELILSAELVGISLKTEPGFKLAWCGAGELVVDGKSYGYRKEWFITASDEETLQDSIAKDGPDAVRRFHRNP